LSPTLLAKKMMVIGCIPHSSLLRLVFSVSDQFDGKILRLEVQSHSYRVMNQKNGHRVVVDALKIVGAESFI